MTFFQGSPIPAPAPRPRAERFVPPPWAGAPRYELPAVVPVGQFLQKTPTFMMAVEAAKVFSTGCLFEVSWMFRRTDQDDRQWSDLNAVFHGGGPQVRDGVISVDSILLFGVELPDGARATTSSRAMYGQSMPTAQEPEQPVFEFQGKGGSSNDDEMGGKGSLWLWPLPPALDLKLVAQWTDMGMAESSIVLDGQHLRDAAGQAQQYWQEIVQS